MKGNWWYMEDNGLRIGSQSSPGSWELYIDGQAYVSDYLRADGGIHVGGSSDPGTDNLIVDGNVGIGTAIPSQKLHVAGNVRITGLVNCNTIDTDGSGNLVCGTDEAGAGGGFGAWVSKSNNTVYQAATDGFVIAYSGMNWTRDIMGYTDSSNPPTTMRIRSRLNTYHSGTSIASITMPVKKNDYWKLTGDATTIYWIPLGN